MIALIFMVSSSNGPVIGLVSCKRHKLPLVPGSEPNQPAWTALVRNSKQEASMLDMRLVTTSLAMMAALMSVALAEPVKDQPAPGLQGAPEVRPIRVILPAPWEPTKGQAESAQSSK
jgi:hypothetical protein